MAKKQPQSEQMQKKQKKQIYSLEILKRVVSRKGGLVGLIILCIMVFCCLAAPLIAPYDPYQVDFSNMYARCSLAHLCGTDAVGRDVFSRLLYGGRYSIALGVSAALLGALLGIVIGSIAGFYGGKVETVIMRLLDVWASIPGILLVIVISAVLGSGFFNTVLALSIGGVPGGARMIRGQILAERSKEYIEAASAMNCSDISIMFRHILPNVVAPSIVSATMEIGGTISMAASLSYLGLGIQPPTAEWGAMLADARQVILTNPTLIMFPGLVIAVFVLAINLLGDSLRDALDPRLRSVIV